MTLSNRLSFNPLISVAIISYSMDRYEDVIELLHSIEIQTYTNLEVILVIGKSDELYRKLVEYINTEIKLNIKTIFNNKDWALSSQRNIGAKEAKGEIIAFVDDDAIVFTDWAYNVAQSFTNDSIIGVTGPAFPLWDEHRFNALLPDELSWIVSCTNWCDWNTIRNVRNVWGMNMAFKKESFERCGYFKTSLGLKGKTGPIAEEVEFSLRVKSATNKNIIFNPNVKVYHKVKTYRFNHKYIAQRSYWMGFSRIYIKNLHIKGQKPFEAETQLINRIILKCSSLILRNFFARPICAINQMTILANSLFFVALGCIVGMWAKMTGNLDYE